MIPVAIEIENFRSFKKPQRFIFPQAPGLYFMRGVNEAEPTLGANGSGKSTIWDALFWCLYEKTTRGLKAGDVSNWDAQKGTRVAFDFYLHQEDVRWTIARTWKPNAWRLSCTSECHEEDPDVGFVGPAPVDLAKDPANPVLAAIRLEAEPFLQSVLMAQNRPMFLDLKRDAQAELFSNVLGLDRWMDYAAKASKEASAQDAITRELERKIARIEGELASTGKQDFRQSSDDWERDRRRRLDELAGEHARGCGERKGLKERLEQALERETQARRGMEQAKPDPALLRAANKLADDLRESTVLLERLRGRGQELSEALEATLEADGDCPTCGQPFANKDRLDQHVDDQQRKAKALKAQIAEEREINERLTGESAEAEQAYLQGEAREIKARKELDEAQRDSAAARRALDLLDRDLDRIEDRAEELERERNPYAEMERDAQRRGRQLREELDALREELDSSNSRYGLLSFWVRGFKEIRLQEIAEALTELEVEVNSCVTALGLIDWELRFAVDREGKGGGIQRGFNVTVKSPQQPFPTPWEAWSGGEAQRLCIAGNMGLGNLIRSRTGSMIDLEVWDEPTNGLSPEGIHDLLSCLASRARTEQRVIFLVDHKAHDFGGFAGQYTIVKAPSGSRIREGAYS